MRNLSTSSNKTDYWQSSQSAARNPAAPIAMNFSIPGNYSATDTSDPSAPILTDPFTVNFKVNPPLVIPAGCNCSLVQASFAYTQPNIAAPGILVSQFAGNNRITISFAGGPATDYFLPTGLYDYFDVQTQLNLIARDQGWILTSTDLFILTGISATQKIIFSMNPVALPGAAFPAGGITVSFQNPGVLALNDSIGEVLGFTPTLIGPTIVAPAAGTVIVSQEGDAVADFGNTSAYALYISIVNGTYVNGLIGQLLYVFPLGNSAPNSVVSYQPSLIFPVQASSGTFSSIQVWTTDQSGNKLPWSYYQAPFQFSLLIGKNKSDGSV